jgi:group I intron endonuclease
LYFGQTIDGYLKRFQRHIEKSESKKGAFRLHKAIKKYGIDNFKIERVCICPENLLDKMEIFYIAKYKTNICKHGDEFGYNMTDGGEGGKGRTVSEKTKQLMREAATGRKMPEEAKKKMSETRRGGKLSRKTKKKISKSCKKYFKEHPEVVRRLNEGLIGNTHGFKKNQEPWHKGKTNVYTKETLEKMSESAKIGWEKRREKEK